MPRPATNSKQARAIALYRDGRSVEYIAEVLEQNASDVRRTLRHAGLVVGRSRAKPNAGHQLKMYQRADPPPAEVIRLMRGWR